MNLPLSRNATANVGQTGLSSRSPGGQVNFVVEHPSRGEPIPGGGVAAWLLRDGHRSVGAPVLFDELCWRLVGQGLPLARAAISVGTLHPQILGFGFRWWHGRSTVQEYQIGHEVKLTSDYLDSPMRPTLERGEPVRYRLDGGDRIEQFPLLVSLREAGGTDYLAYPLTMFNGRHQTVTWATNEPGGFTDTHLADIEAILPALAVVVEAGVMRRLAATLLDTYLGPTIGRHILNGEVLRGQGQRVRAILMSVDMRGFTALSDRLPGDELIALLDEYFETITVPIHGHGGEVLKFVGDGVLAIFEVGTCSDAAAARSALEAAEEALERLDELNQQRGTVGRSLIRIGIGLHVGEVIYGNVGAADRLDFTAIGPAVNLVCRLEALTKRLDRPLLVSHGFADVCPRPLVSLGFHPVRGLSEPEEVFGLPDG